MNIEEIVSQILAVNPKKTTYHRKEIVAFLKERGLTTNLITKMEPYRFGWGAYNFEKVHQEMAEAAPPSNPELVPEKNINFIPFGHYHDIRSLIQSRIFFPLMITGPTGNGKTEMVLQAAAENNRSLFRVNITVETDEDSLIGGLRLQDGNTIFQKGPVINCMEAGGILLLDEADLGLPTKIMCLQSILEGNGYFIKKTGEWVMPAPGFQIIATANTKGTGDPTGNYSGTQILNESFLERFAIVMENDYPTKATEVRIASRLAHSIGCDMKDDEIKLLVEWAIKTRKLQKEQGINQCISTRRLIHIIRGRKIFGSTDKAIELCIARFEDAVKKAFLDLYQSMQPPVVIDDTLNDRGKTNLTPGRVTNLKQKSTANTVFGSIAAIPQSNTTTYTIHAPNPGIWNTSGRDKEFYGRLDRMFNNKGE